MRRFVLILVIVNVAMVVLGVAWWSHKTRIDPFRASWDRITGYGAGHERHRFPEADRVVWDPIGEHNARIAGLDPDAAAYPLLARAARMYSDLDLSEVRFAEPDVPAWDRLKEVLDLPGVRVFLAELVLASHRPGFGMPMLGQIHDTMPFEYPESLELVRMRMERLLITDAFAGALSGDFERFHTHIEAALRLQSIEAEPPLRISQSRRRMLVQIIIQRIGQVLNTDPGMIDEQAAGSIDRLLAELAESGILLVNGDAELIFYEDMVRRMVNDRGVYDRSKVAALVGTSLAAGSGLPPPSSAPRSAFTPSLLSSLIVLEKEYERAVAASSVPWVLPAEGWLDAEVWMDRVDSVPGRAGRMLTGYSLLGLKLESANFRTQHQALIGLRVALAAHRHHLRHDQPPASLDAIDADLLDFEPVDGFTGGRLIYRWTGEGHLVYALGADGDDDAGRHAVGPDAEPVGLISDEYLLGKWDGDWVVFPPRE